MKKIILGSILTCLVAAGVVFAAGEKTEGPVPAHRTESLDQSWQSDFDQYAPVKKCSFNSDCPYGKCKSGQCGGCDFNSDCKGWGKCKSGRCGACDFASDCGKAGFGSCSSGSCTKSPY